MSERDLLFSKFQPEYNYDFFKSNIDQAKKLTLNWNIIIPCGTASNSLKQQLESELKVEILVIGKKEIG